MYLQGYLTEFNKSYPCLKIDLFVNTKKQFFLRRKMDTQVKYLRDTVQEKHHINTIYFNPAAPLQALKLAQLAKYPLIILLDRTFSTQPIRLAKYLNPTCVLIGAASKTHWYNLFKKRAFNRLNSRLECATLECAQATLADFYSNIFTLITNSEKIVRKPFLQVPRKWIIYAKLRFLKWEIDKRGHRFGRVFFMNSFDDNGGHSLPLKSLYKIIVELKRNDEHGDINFVLHAPQSKFKETKKFFDKNSINNLFLLCANYDFFQIPSLLSLSDVVYSVDGFCVDLANAFNIPIVKIDKNLCVKL
jgi:ADP-heptose:LPS heptosyltransferase